jgi:hypothetical protein
MPQRDEGISSRAKKARGNFVEFAALEISVEPDEGRSAAKTSIDFVGSMRGLNPRPPAELFSRPLRHD